MFGRKKNRTIYHDVADYKCPMCKHLVPQHRNATLIIDEGCTICHCNLSQSNLWHKAKKWQYESDTNVLLEFINLPKDTN